MNIKTFYQPTHITVKSIRHDVEREAGRNPFLSSYTHFVHAITGRGYSPRVVYRSFFDLVDPEDYHNDRKIAKELLERNLYPLAKPLEE